jgi:erythromycin esterase-like protein
LVSRLREEIQANKNLPPDQILNLVLAEIVAEGVGVCLEIQTLEHPEKFYARDRSMAKNIINLAEGIFSESRIIIWAHNTHLCQEPVRLIPLKQDFYNLKNWWSSSTGPLALNTGSLLADHFGDDYFVLGLLTNSGRMGNFQSNDGWLPVRPPRQDSVESLLQLKSEPAVFLDLGKDSSIFAGKPLYFRSGGISWQKAYITKQFDSLVVVEKVSPPERLSKRDFQ